MIEATPVWLKPRAPSESGQDSKNTIPWSLSHFWISSLTSTLPGGGVTTIFLSARSTRSRLCLLMSLLTLHPANYLPLSRPT